MKASYYRNAFFAFAGALIGVVLLWAVVDKQLRHRRARAERREIAELVEALGPRFSSVKVRITSHPRPIVMGEVKTEEDWRLLYERVEQAFGAERTKLMMIGMRIGGVPAREKIDLYAPPGTDADGNADSRDAAAERDEPTE